MYIEEYPKRLQPLLTYEHDVHMIEWPDYPEKFGLEPQDIPDLIRMMLDRRFGELDIDSPEVWAPMHAWRALGQLRAVKAISAMISLFNPLKDDGDFVEEVPRVLGLIGTPAIQPLATYLADTDHSLEARMLAITSLQMIGVFSDQVRGRCIALLHRQLQQYANQPSLLNAEIIGSLLDLDAAGALPTIAAAFTADRVDDVYVSWDDVLDAFGPLAERFNGIVMGEATPADHEQAA